MSNVKITAPTEDILSLVIIGNNSQLKFIGQTQPCISPVTAVNLMYELQNLS